MNLQEYKINCLQEFSALLSFENEVFASVCRQAEIKNKWFTQEAIKQAFEAIKSNYLSKEKLENWLLNYSLHGVDKIIGIIAAGNIPLAGFHDILCCFVCNAPVLVKTSSKDEALLKFVVNSLKEIDITWKAEISDRLKQYDAVIATGSNNSNRYFEQYFSKVPNILRKNRNSIAILNGNETDKELNELTKDIFTYFGLGCRNVSFLLLPKGYNVEELFPHFESYQHFNGHALYKDNYDYNRTLLLMNKELHLANDFIMLKEEPALQSRLATLHYSFYNTEEDIQNFLIDHHAEIQTVVCKDNQKWKSVPFGKAQEPTLQDYADGLDTLGFLLGL